MDDIELEPAAEPASELEPEITTPRVIAIAPYVRVEIASDGLQANLQLLVCTERDAPESTAIFPPLPEVCAQIMQMIQAAGVSEPIDVAAVQRIAAAWCETGQPHEGVVARGRAAEHGVSASLKIFQPPQPSHDTATAVHHRERAYLSNVAKNFVLAEITRATAGRNGVQVTGDEIPALAGAPVEDMAISPLVAVDDREFKIIYRAAADAILTELTARRITVVDQITIARNINYDTGNIEAWGAVTIQGSVEPNFSVRARGDVTVQGGVESAFVATDGNLTVGGGIFGKSGTTEIQCGNNCTARFVENAQITAGGSITVQDSIVNSRLYANTTIQTTERRGVVLTSHLVSGVAVLANVYGSTAELPVTAVTGSDPQTWLQLERFRRELRFLRRQMMKGLAPLHGNIRPAWARGLQDRNAKRRRMGSIIERITHRREKNMLSNLADGTAGPRIVAHRNVFPKTHVQIGPFKFFVEDNLRAGIFGVDLSLGKIVWRSK